MSLRTFSLTVALLGAIPHAAADCPADLDEDGRVDSADLGLLLADWGTSSALADLDQDGLVTGSDLAIVLAGWGACPEPVTCTSSGFLAFESFRGGDASGIQHSNELLLETSTEIDCESPVLFDGSLTHTTWKVVTYPVGGATLAEACVAIFDPVSGAGPADGEGRHAGYAYGKFDVVVDCIDLPIEQDESTAHPWWTGLRGEVTILVPEWTGAATASPAEAAAWSTFISDLIAHELEHAEIFDDMITVMLARHLCDLPGLPWCLPPEIPMPLPSFGACTVNEGASSPEAIEIAEVVAEWLYNSSDYEDMKNGQTLLDAASGHGPSLDCSGG